MQHAFAASFSFCIENKRDIHCRALHQLKIIVPCFWPVFNILFIYAPAFSPSSGRFFGEDAVMIGCYDRWQGTDAIHKFVRAFLLSHIRAYILITRFSVCPSVCFWCYTQIAATFRTAHQPCKQRVRPAMGPDCIFPRLHPAFPAC